MIQLFLIDVRLAFNSGERACIFISNQRREAVLLTEEESIDEKKKSPENWFRISGIGLGFYSFPRITLYCTMTFNTGLYFNNQSTKCQPPCTMMQRDVNIEMA